VCVAVRSRGKIGVGEQDSDLTTVGSLIGSPSISIGDSRICSWRLVPQLFLHDSTRTPWYVPPGVWLTEYPVVRPSCDAVVEWRRPLPWLDPVSFVMVVVGTIKFGWYGRGEGTSYAIVQHFSSCVRVAAACSGHARTQRTLRYVRIITCSERKCVVEGIEPNTSARIPC
jgi:hypothetical protein